jgi:pilus assembly protein CpaC
MVVPHRAALNTTTGEQTITTAALGTTNVEFKPYGVHLNIEPEVLKNGQIRMKLEAAVSSPDQTNGVSVSGNTVPALLERKVTSQVTVSSGTTMTLAGLVQTHKETAESGVPILRRIPFLGVLFRWKKAQFRRTTVIVFVTPRVINF